MKPFSVAGSVLGLLMLCFLAAYFSLMGEWPWESDSPNLPWNRMSHKEVCRTWGEHPLDTEKFKSAAGPDPWE